jgi:hypothetical protein
LLSGNEGSPTVGFDFKEKTNGKRRAEAASIEALETEMGGVKVYEIH